MLQLLHAAATVPAVVAACCTLTARTARTASGVAAVLMLVAMIAAALRPAPAMFAVGAAAMWGAALVGAAAIRRTTTGTTAHTMAWHRVGGAIAMALVMLTMALHHSGAGNVVATNAHHHDAGPDAGGLQAWALLIAGAAVIGFVAQSAHALTWMHHTHAVAPPLSFSRSATVEIVSMAAMLILMSAAIFL